MADRSELSSLRHAVRKRLPGRSWASLAVVVVMTAVVLVMSEPLAMGTTMASAAVDDPPVVVLTNQGDPFSRYYGEILQAEGLNDFELVDVTALSAATLADRAVALLPPTALTASQTDLLTRWVEGGGRLIALRPGPALASLLGLGGVTGTLSDAYYKVDTSAPPGRGITADTMQFHGTADRWTLAGATPIATLYPTATTGSGDPAVTLRRMGAAGGQAAAFSFDVARSVVYTRQGNPAWAGQERDFAKDSEIRSDDLFFGAKPGDPQPDWVNLDKVRIPQADELQRLLVNLITEMSADRVPLPRFWYLPRGEKAAVIMADDDGRGGTATQFDQLIAESPTGCSVAEWTCPRATSFMFPGAPISDAQVAGYQAQGFELALRPTTDCSDYTRTTLETAWQDQLAAAAAQWPSMAPGRSSRTYCVPWSDWATQPLVEAEHGVRLDTNYYYWPASWVGNRPGLFTGSGFPMRFADLDGSVIDVYQAATQLTDESGIDVPTHIRALLDAALGPDGYYGVFTANMGGDMSDISGADAIVAEAQARGVPVISARQMLNWLDLRNGSSFTHVSFAGAELRFGISIPGDDGSGLEAMLPATGANGGPFKSLSHGTDTVATTRRTVKGVDYVVFGAEAGDYVATYDPPPAASGAPGPSPAGSPLPALGPAQPPRATMPHMRATIRLGPKRPHVSRSGTVTLRASCPNCRGARRVKVSLRWGRRSVASRAFTMRGTHGRVRLSLSRAARRRIDTRKSLTVVATAATGSGGASSRSHETMKLVATAP